MEPSLPKTIILLCAVAWCQGLDLNLNRVNLDVTVAQSHCGVLICEEDTNASDSNEYFRNISSISVFKVVAARAIGNDKCRREVLFGSVTFENPNVTRIRNGNKVEGLLDAGRGSVRVELAKPEDCEAEFTCQVQGLDSQGREVASTASLPQQPGQKSNHADDGSSRPGISQHLLASIQKMVTQSMKGLEKKILIQIDEKFSTELPQFRSEVLNSSYDLLASMQSGNWNDTSASTKDVRLSHRDLDSTSHNDSTVTRSELRDLMLESESRRTNNLKAMLTDVVASNACDKGMLAFLSRRLPHPVTYPKNTLNFPYPCDTVTDGGGWIIIQRRSTGNTDFDRDWDDYKNGFGSFDGDFWLGNNKIHTITSSGTYELRIDLRYNGTSSFAHYSTFSIASESYSEGTNDRSRYYSSSHVPKGYKLSIGTYDGTAGDSLRDNNERPFSTRDVDRDSSAGNCGTQYSGGWWFVGCGYTCLNGKWGAGANRGMEWRDLTGGLSVSFSEMKIRLVR